MAVVQRREVWRNLNLSHHLHGCHSPGKMASEGHEVLLSEEAWRKKLCSSLELKINVFSKMLAAAELGEVSEYSLYRSCIFSGK